MSVKIRLKRVGSKNHPIFRVVVADSRSPRDGKCIEEVGTYNPQLKSNNYQLNLPRVDHWLARGAQPSETVASFIKHLRKEAATATATTATATA
jgi:small subunit ribosomal protein S16